MYLYKVLFFLLLVFTHFAYAEGERNSWKYPLNGISEANDSSVNSCHGTINGAVLTTGRFDEENGAYLFENGSIDFLEPTCFGFTKNSAITISAWVTVTSDDKYRSFLSTSFSNTDTPTLLYFGTNRSGLGDNAGINFSLYTKGKGKNGTALSTETTAQLVEKNWVKLTGVIDGQAKTIKLYINDELAKESAINNDFDLSSVKFYLGKAGYFGSKGGFWGGKITDLTIWDKPLSHTEIQNSYNTDITTTSIANVALNNITNTTNTVSNNNTSTNISTVINGRTTTESITESMATCLFKKAQSLFPDYFYPVTRTEKVEIEAGKFAFTRNYPNFLSPASLAIYENKVLYALEGNWFYYADFDTANEQLANGECSEEGSNPLTSYANVLSSVKWDSPIINVCWENPTPANNYYRKIVQNATESTWEKFSAIDLIGWEQCTENSQGIRIIFSDEPGGTLQHWPHTKGLGKQLNGRPNGMLLNHEFINWVEGGDCLNKKDYCVRGIAIHEFGHALGFAHEQARQDTPAWCNHFQEGGETDGDLYIGEWDSNSVMNYCNKNSHDGNLSETDIKAAQQIYGKPASLTFDASVIDIKYHYNSSSCPNQYPVLIELFFSTDGVNQSDLIYSQSQPNSYEEKISLNQNHVLHSFCTIADWKGTLSFHLKEVSTGKLSNVINTQIDTTSSDNSLPTQPTNLVGAALSSHSIKLTWSDIQGEDGVYIYRSLGGEWVKIATLGRDISTYTDTGLQSNTRYYYHISSYNNAGNSPSYSVSVSTESENIVSLLLNLNISGINNTVYIKETSGAGDIGNHSISGVDENVTFYLSANNKAVIDLSGINEIVFIDASLRDNVNYTLSGINTNVIFQ